MVQAAFHRTENRNLLTAESISHNRPGSSRIEDQIIAREFLSKLTACDPYPPYIRRFMECLIELGPETILIEKHYKRTHSFQLDMQPVMDRLGISLSATRHYLVDARKIIHALFNPDGTLFTRAR